MVALVATALIGFGWVQDPPTETPPDQPAARLFRLAEPAGEPRRLWLRVPEDPLDPPKRSPAAFPPANEPWEFPWLIDAYGPDPRGDTEEAKLRFRVFSQAPRNDQDPAPKVARMAIRMWDRSVRLLGIDHPMAYNSGIVDIYLAWGGTPGGEHRFDDDVEGGISRKVNTIYIYQIQSFTNPVEMAREVAHEYGHAVLPPVGGFKEPEYWVNGDLGEKVFLRLLHRDMLRGALDTRDAMGATTEQIGTWLANEADPLAAGFLAVGPNPAPLRGTDRKALNAYLGAALYAMDILPDRAFGRALRLTGSQNAVDILKGVVAAANEPLKLEFRIPTYAAGKPLWLPVGSGRLEGATIVRRSADRQWALVRPLPGKTVALANPS